ncbi:MAG: hypothetical protein ABF646_04480 [Acetobacter papayae]
MGTFLTAVVLTRAVTLAASLRVNGTNLYGVIFYWSTKNSGINKIQKSTPQNVILCPTDQGGRRRVVITNKKQKNGSAFFVIIRRTE